jgi:hypothetical protein
MRCWFTGRIINNHKEHQEHKEARREIKKTRHFGTGQEIIFINKPGKYKSQRYTTATDFNTPRISLPFARVKQYHLK